MSAILKFKEAAKELQQSEECKAYDAARKAYDDDSELQAKIGEFNLLRLDLNNEMSKEPRDNDKIAELNSQTSQLYGEIMDSQSMAALNDAKASIERMIGHVNAIINTAIEGGDPMAVEEPAEEECGGSCGSCGGCGH
ncbi:YlbF family regulator [Ruminococcaceae bacterium OttesenSCG-928-A16]|nr:YlbF family regulator [Ruminococcaceae bacterium OttesenSCG-928-A16]